VQCLIACVEILLALQDFFPDKAARRQVEDLVGQCKKCSWTGKRKEFDVSLN